jgi:hypothetical protein
MSYFWLKQSKRVKNPLLMQGIDLNYYKLNPTIEEFEKLPELLVTYFDYEKRLEVSDILDRPTIFISPKLRDLIELYDETVKYRGVQMFPTIETVKVRPLYWTIYPQVIDCLHESCEKNPNGSIKEMILDRRKAGTHDIMRIGGLLENRIVVSLALAESIMRRPFYGVELEKVRMI